MDGAVFIIRGAGSRNVKAAGDIHIVIVAFDVQSRNDLSLTGDLAKVAGIKIQRAFKGDVIAITAHRDTRQWRIFSQHGVTGIVGADVNVAQNIDRVIAAANVDTGCALEDAVAVLNGSDSNIAVQLNGRVCATDQRTGTVEADIDTAFIFKGILLACDHKADRSVVADRGIAIVDEATVLTVGNDPHRAVSDQQVAVLRQLCVIAVDDDNGGAYAIHVNITHIQHASAVALNVGTCRAIKNGLLAGVHDIGIVAFDIQARGASTACRRCPAVIHAGVVTVNDCPGRAIGNVQLTEVFEMRVVADNHRAGRTFTANVRGAFVIDSYPVAIDNRPRAAASDVEVAGEVRHGVIAGDQRADGVVYRGMAGDGVHGGIAGNYHADRTVGDGRVPGQGIFCTVTGNNHPGFIFPADGDPTTGVMFFTIAGDNLRLVIGQNQISLTVVFPVKAAIALGTFDHRGVSVGNVPAGDVQRFAVLSGELPFIVLL